MTLGSKWATERLPLSEIGCPLISAPKVTLRQPNNSKKIYIPTIYLMPVLLEKYSKIIGFKKLFLG